MPYFTLNEDVRLYYDDEGQGQPVLFIHGMLMSSRFFARQLPWFGTHKRSQYRALALDLRGHGRSSYVYDGHTITTYADDLKTFIHRLGLNDVVLVGWSMGALVVWDYLKQFGAERIIATVIVDQGPSDFKWPDWPLGTFDFAQLSEAMHAVQTQYDSYMRRIVPAMFKQPLSPAEQALMLAEVTRIPASIASAILFDQTVQDYRPTLAEISVPTLLCFGAENRPNGDYLAQRLPDAQLVIFENSNHCPFFEEPEHFNHEVEQFIQRLDYENPG